jgi:hypothetical protein
MFSDGFTDCRFSSYYVARSNSSTFVSNTDKRSPFSLANDVVWFIFFWSNVSAFTFVNFVCFKVALVSTYGISVFSCD